VFQILAEQTSNDKITYIRSYYKYLLKGVILHGGAGTRLRPITQNGPKQLIPIANKPMSQYALGYLLDSEVREVAIILGDVYPQKVKDYYGDGSKFGCRIEYIEQGKPLGIAHAVSLTKDFVDDDRFVVVLGDNLISDSIERFAKDFNGSDLDAFLLLSHTSHPQDFGIARISDEGKIIELIEKPKEPPSDLAVTGIYFFSPVIYDHISRLKPSKRGEYEITEAIQSLINDGGNVGYEIITGWWKDTGTVDDILAANRLVLERIDRDFDGRNIQGKVSIGNYTKISDDSLIRGPAVIGDNVIIEENAYIGPFTSVGDNCVIRKASIENSIIMKSSVVDTDSIIVDSVIGENTKVMNSVNLKPVGKRMIVGENSIVYI
jgi:glucose-1-phosphate thymidylyltransferase